MRFFLLCLILFPSLLFAQSKHGKSSADSVAYYSNLIRDHYKQTLDSLKNAPDIKEAENRLDYFSSRSDSYRSFTVYTDIAAADFDYLNSTLVPEGFSPFRKTISRIGYGSSAKYNKVILDFYLTTFGLSNKSKKEEENVKATFNNFIQFDLGYDFIRSQSVNIYPYAGISLRSMTLEYNKPEQTNGSYTDITNIVQNDPSIYATAGGIGYQAGIGFDFVISNNKGRTGGTMLFVKTGTNGIFGNPSYEIGDIKYNPQIKYGRWIVTAGFKFFGRKPRSLDSDKK